jgi:hypothetical protein
MCIPLAAAVSAADEAAGGNASSLFLPFAAAGDVAV